jgi:uncharacterized repeat protein (TIGR03803 family)
MLYGLTVNGGKSSGTIFEIGADGSSFSNLYSFSELTYSPSLQNNVNPDGANPAGELVSDGGAFLYGVTQNGGKNGAGTIFKIGTDGSGFTILHTFSAPTYDSASQLYTNADGASPYSGLILSGSTLYGTTVGGGSNSGGVVFRMDVSGAPFSNLYSFTAAIRNPATGIYTNNDGSFPEGNLYLLDGVLYGTAYDGGKNGSGAVFRVNAGGGSFTNLHSFAPPVDDKVHSIYTNRDGLYPNAGLVSDGAALYSTTYMGGSLGYGSVFRLDLSGGSFTNLHNFTYGNDGANARSGLVLSNNVLYGTAENGGSTGYVAVFQLSTSGTGFRTIYSFSAANPNASEVDTNGDGESPDSRLLLSGGILYGTASGGGTGGTGTVFAINLNTGPEPIRLNFQWAQTNLILTWTNAAFLLQTSSNVSSAYADIPGAASPFTNPPAVSTKFFRLRLP